MRGHIRERSPGHWAIIPGAPRPFCEVTCAARPFAGVTILPISATP